MLWDACVPFGSPESQSRLLSVSCLSGNHRPLNSGPFATPAVWESRAPRVPTAEYLAGLHRRRWRAVHLGRPLDSIRFSYEPRGSRYIIPRNPQWIRSSRVFPPYFPDSKVSWPSWKHESGLRAQFQLLASDLNPRLFKLCSELKLCRGGFHKWG